MSVIEDNISRISKEQWTDGYQQGRADAIDELKPFFKELEDFPLEWICDELCGEFLNPNTDESWCSEHCHNATDYECVKKWCEWKRLKEQKNE